MDRKFINEVLQKREPSFHEQLADQIHAASVDGFDNAFHKVAKPMTRDQWDIAFSKGYIAGMTRQLTVHETLLGAPIAEPAGNGSDEYEYQKLIVRVEKIDPQAADYLRVDAKNLQSFYFNGNLSAVFIWSESPQGSEYWGTISEKLSIAKNHPAAGGKRG